MKEEVIDTNVLLRFFVGDDKSQQKQASDWFSQRKKAKEN